MMNPPPRPMRCLTHEEFDQLRAALHDPGFIASVAAAIASEMVEVDNPMRREVRPRRGTDER